jgi:membrane peptidoglycan carboxypeptidase
LTVWSRAQGPRPPQLYADREGQMSTSRPKTRAQAKASQDRRAKAAKSKGGAGKRWAKRLGITALVGFLLVLVAFFVAYAMIDAPKPNDLAAAQASIIYYADGKTEIDRISEVNRESVLLKQVPKAVQEAHLAAEDRNFYQNSGISPTGIARGAWTTLRGGTAQSGSTITQQYVKNYFLTQDQTLSRKGKEIIISIKIAKQQSKDQILENYLNTIYYGRGAFGIQTASKAYFNKDVSKLTPAEGALLASVVKGPSFFDPGLGASQLANAQARWNYVMDGMVTEGWLTPEARATAQFPTKSLIKYQPNRNTAGPNGFITDAVKRELKAKLKLTDADIDKGGYRIVTTIDQRTQKAAVDAIKARMPTGKGTSTLRVGLTSIKPGDGAVVAMYGGADYGDLRRGHLHRPEHGGLRGRCAVRPECGVPGRVDVQDLHAAGGFVAGQADQHEDQVQRSESAVLQGVRGQGRLERLPAPRWRPQLRTGCG